MFFREVRWLVIAAGLYPLVLAWRANRRTTLPDSIVWAFAAWLAWGLALTHFENEDLVYLALCLTGCAGVAVLGARRPYVLAWNFVVLSLLGVMALPLVEQSILQVHSFNIERKVFLTAILVVAIGNFVATRLGAAAIGIGVGCSIGMMRITDAPNRDGFTSNSVLDLIVAVAVGAAPWLGWALVSLRKSPNAFDADWLAFRDRFGFVWGSRVRDQFNAAAKNAALPIHLGWSGGQPLNPGEALPVDDARSILKAITKRFDADG